ncbi:hypothetical protein BJV77DRAFT_330428 [Russula vinacea]|nr:hypothetical protein BJV77DRAFT_330428 [Russula vinacea]
MSSSLASIVSDPEDTDTWRKLKDSKSLAKLHARFWGKGMVQEEVSSQTSDLSKREDLDINESTEDDTSESIEDDTKNGYVLVLDNKAFPNKRIWADYIRIYDFLVKRWQNDYNNGLAIGSRRAPSTVITGQPGIGKSLWVYYALCRCLSGKRPVVWFYKKKLYMFVEEGVYDMGTDYNKADFNTFVWTLVDSDEAESGVPESLVPQSTLFSVIYTTYPAKRRWSRLHKTTSNIVIVMNPWSRSEIHRAAALLEDTDRPSTDVIDDTFDRFGPTPKICIEAASVPDDLRAYEVEVNDALNQVNLERLLEFTRNARNLTMDKTSHKLYLIRRTDINRIRSEVLISPITEHIQSEIANRIEGNGRE